MLRFLARSLPQGFRIAQSGELKSQRGNAIVNVLQPCVISAKDGFTQGTRLERFYRLDLL